MPRVQKQWARSRPVALPDGSAPQLVLLVRSGHATAALAGLKEPADLGHLGVHRTGEPFGGHQVVEPSQRTVAQLKFLDVMNARAPFYGIDLEPGVEASRDAMLQGDV